MADPSVNCPFLNVTVLEYVPVWLALSQPTATTQIPKRIDRAIRTPTALYNAAQGRAAHPGYDGSETRVTPKALYNLSPTMFNAFSVYGHVVESTQGALRDPGLCRVTASQ